MKLAQPLAERTGLRGRCGKTMVSRSLDLFEGMTLEALDSRSYTCLLGNTGPSIPSREGKGVAYAGSRSGRGWRGGLMSFKIVRCFVGSGSNSGMCARSRRK